MTSTNALGMRARAGLLVLLALAGLLIASGPASAEAPFRVPSQITDQNNSIGCSNTDVNNALSTLRAKDSVQLWVVFTDSFSGTDGQTWANQAAAKSGFGSNTILLAVATRGPVVRVFGSDRLPAVAGAADVSRPAGHRARSRPLGLGRSGYRRSQRIPSGTR